MVANRLIAAAIVVAFAITGPPKGGYHVLRYLASGFNRTVYAQPPEPPASPRARTPSLGSLTFPLVLEHVSDMATVDDTTLLRTMFFLWERMKLVVEPTGALGAAAAMEGTTSIRGARVGVILSGGNVDLSQVSEWLRIV